MWRCLLWITAVWAVADWNRGWEGCRCRDGPPVCSCRQLDHIPSNLSFNVQRISLSSHKLEVLRRGGLQLYAETLSDFYIESAKKLRQVEVGAFSNLKKIRTIYIKQAPLLRNLPEGVLSGILPNLKFIRILQTGLEEVPSLKGLQYRGILSMIDLDSNKIQSLPIHSLRVKAEIVNLDYNLIRTIEDGAFEGSQIAQLSLKGNRLLKTIQASAFDGLHNLRKLDISETSITLLPTRGLEQLEVLKIVDTFTLKKFPSVLHFAQIREAHLTYPYHCCAFRFPQTHDPDNYRTFEAHCGHTTTEPPDIDSDSQSWGTFHPPGSKMDRVVRDVNIDWTSPASAMDHFGHFVYASAPGELDSNDSQRWSSVLGNPPEMGFGKYVGGQRGRKLSEGIDVEGTFHRTTISVEPELQAFCGNLSVSARYREVKCSPEPDAFNPCEDVLGNAGLRACAWLVVVAAVLGNLAVMVVLMSNRFTMSVSKFLMCNLAFADMCMGVYLFIIVAVDAHTMGAYFNYAIDWQHGIGCQAAGFITVFASELSIYTLALITLERWFAITYAIHLHKRLQLGLAAKIMVAGWVYAISMASLPLMGISGYSKTSICLPMENLRPSDLAYLISLLTINGLAFLLISGCYAKMYYSIAQQKSKAINSDMTVAKRMAMLVFTDFACWAPIAFFGLTAVAGHPLIDVTKSKILLVFFYPLNSCANPFLYAILTKQYRRDFFILASRYGFCTKKAMKYKGTYSFNQHHHMMLKSNNLVLHPGPRLNRLKDSSEGLADSDTTCEIIRFNSSKKKKRSSRQWSDERSSECKGSPHPLKNTFTRSPTLQHQELLKLVISQDAHGSKTPELIWAQSEDLPYL